MESELEYELVELIQTINPEVLGARIKTARISAGLRQHQLADGISSTPYISRIESGMRKPSLTVLTAIAERAGTTCATLLRGIPDPEYADIELAIQQAHLELRNGDADAAMTRSTDALARIPAGLVSSLRNRARRCQAAALEATGATAQAVTLLQDLLEEANTDQQWIAISIALSRCHRQLGHLRAAIEVGERARHHLSASALDGTTEGIQLSLTIAGALFERGDVADAIEVCERAIAQSDALSSPIAQASAYWNASVIEARRGNTSIALDYANKAIPLFETSDDQRNRARLRAELGILQLQDGKPEEARATLAIAEHDMERAPVSMTDRARVALAFAEVDHLLGDTSSATRRLNELDPTALASSPLMAAELAMLQGRIAAYQGNDADAVAHYRSAATSLSAINADRGVGEAWFEVAELLNALGATADAQSAYRAAAAAAGYAARTSHRLSDQLNPRGISSTTSAR